MNEKNWPTYLKNVANGDTGTQIAHKTGIPDSTISRWLSGQVEPRPRQVVEIARAYGENPLVALVYAGYLTEDEIKQPAAPPRLLQLHDFTDLEIATEMLRRVEEGSELADTPLDENHPAWRKRGESS